MTCPTSQVALEYARLGQERSDTFHFCLPNVDAHGRYTGEKVQPPRIILLGENLMGSAWMWFGHSRVAIPADGWRGSARGYAAVSGLASDRTMTVCLATTVFESVENIRLLKVFADQIPLDR